MKKLIIIAGSIILGAYLYSMILGNDPNTMKSSTEGVMQKQITIYKTTP